MGYNRSYPACITRQPGTVVGSQLMPNQLVRADTQCPPPGIGRHGKGCLCEII
jgi:hypothetical protein